MERIHGVGEQKRISWHTLVAPFIAEAICSLLLNVCIRRDTACSWTRICVNFCMYRRVRTRSFARILQAFCYVDRRRQRMVFEPVEEVVTNKCGCVGRSENEKGDLCQQITQGPLLTHLPTNHPSPLHIQNQPTHHIPRLSILLDIRHSFLLLLFQLTLLPF